MTPFAATANFSNRPNIHVQIVDVFEITLESLRATVARWVPPHISRSLLTTLLVPLAVVPTVTTCVMRL